MADNKSTTSLPRLQPPPSHGRHHSPAENLNVIHEHSPLPLVPSGGHDYGLARESGDQTTMSSQNHIDIFKRKDVPPGNSYRIAVTEPTKSQFRGGFAIPEMVSQEDRRDLPGYSYRVAVGEPARAPTGVDIGMMSYGTLDTYIEPKHIHSAKKGVSFNPSGNSNINPAYSDTWSRAASMSSLGSNASKGDYVYHITPDGRVQKKLVMTKADGTRIILTDAARRCHKPLTEGDIRRLMILSVISIILFFPTGIPALLYARQTKMKFRESLEPSTMYRSNTYANRTEKLIVASVVMAILVVMFVVSITLGGSGDAVVARDELTANRGLSGDR